MGSACTKPSRIERVFERRRRKQAAADGEASQILQCAHHAKTLLSCHEGYRARRRGLLHCSLARRSRRRRRRAQPTFRSGVELVTIDVVATDRSGKPVHDLKASDFELFEDGKSQPIKTFQFIDASMVPTEAILPPGVVSNDVEPGGIFALVLDEIGYYVDRGPGRAARRGAIPEGRAAAARSRRGRSLGRRLGFHADVGSHARARGDSVGRPAGAIAAFVSNGPARRMPSAPVISIRRRPVRSARAASKCSKRVVDKLRPIPARRKAIVWFSRGGELPANWETNLEIGQPIGRNEEALRSLIDRARAANVAIYTVDPRGLVAPSTAGRDNPGAARLRGDRHASRSRGRDRRPRHRQHQRHRRQRCARMAVENRAYYLLGYEPAAVDGSKKPKARKIRVVTKAPGVELLHRSLYLPGCRRRKRLRS